jgi:hypothetical protein
MKRVTLAAVCLTAGLFTACASSEPRHQPTGGSGGTTPTGGSGGTPTGGSGGSGGTAPTGGSGGSASPDAGTAPNPDGAVATDGGPASDATMGGGSALFTNFAPKQPMPKSLKDTGIYPSFPDITTVDTRLHHYVPDPALYSDGLHKERYIFLPSGKKVDVSDKDNWDFPLGTMFVKTFSDDTHPVETRVIRRVDDPFESYEFNVYKWSADGKTADLATIAGDMHNPVPAKIGTVSFMHTIPSESDCKECHNRAHKKDGLPTSNYIGFDEIRLNNKQGTDTKTQLQNFTDMGFFNAPITTPRDVRDPTSPIREQVKRFIFGNCVHCHNPSETGQADFSPDVLVASVRNKMSMSHIDPPPGYLIAVPNKPEMSILWLQASAGPEFDAVLKKKADSNLHPMPPVGVEQRGFAEFKTGTDAIKTWIMGGAN